MQDTVDQIEQAVVMTGGIVDAIAVDAWDRATPCDEWSVRDVVNHVVGGMRIYAAELTGTAAGGAHEDDWLGDDPQSAYRDAAVRVLAAWRTPGAEHCLINLSFGQVPAPMAAVIELTEVLVHGLDVAVATQREDLIDQDQCAALLATMTAMGVDGFRTPGIFGPQAAVDLDALPHQQLLAFLGRTLPTAAAV
jgi:uncharacterized protein (TIGR03086 family)